MMGGAGFGRQQGPNSSIESLPNPFANLSPPSIPQSRGPEAVGRMPSPTLGFENFNPAVRPYQSAGAQRKPEASERRPSPPFGFQNPIPSERPYQSAGSQERPEALQRLQSPPLNFDRTSHAGNLPYPSAGVHRPVLPPPRWDDGQKSFSKDFDSESHPKPSAAISSRSSGTTITAKISRFHGPKRTRSPSSRSTDEEDSRISIHTVPHSFQSGFEVGNKSPLIPPRAQSPSSDFGNNNSGGDAPALSIQPQQSNYHSKNSNSQVPKRSLPSTANGVAANRPANFLFTKRTRSPLLPSTKEGLQGVSGSFQDDADREMQAKAKRLARFRIELSDTMPVSSTDAADKKVPTNRHDQSLVERQNYAGEHPIESARDKATGHAITEDEGVETSTVITGLCPDMCPESERAERERKGDLDRYERLDGDRNQTRKNIAVKKYNRTAEREAHLIRPMPILQKTIDYLLNLLDQPYDNRFLGMYNFLWDRMRAVRMDLRMQHIFNQGAITMLEQMIRLHIVAMHELCEYTKGEGFSEGFDAHLNIEQMNKTSVELFQMYDDHRKKGLAVPTEKEFRGYYALLKLDKHPGYKVEPAELSLDLAKMTPEIRQTPEVLFARDVARACRTGNYIAFFRLTRKASYLQSCLMHAHFAKLRTQALASLHCGLQNNQGLPVALAAKWLGMEEEDMESLLEYHGFCIKEFEEPYMVKDGLFLNADKDYPTKCSNLVHLKKARTIVEDVSPSCQLEMFPTKATHEFQPSTHSKQDSKLILSFEKPSLFQAAKNKPDSKPVSSLKRTPVKCSIEKPIIDRQYDHLVAPSPLSFCVDHIPPIYPPAKVGVIEKPNNAVLPKKNILFAPEATLLQTPLQAVSRSPMQEFFQSGPYESNVATPLQAVSRSSMQDTFLSDGTYDYNAEKSLPQNVLRNHFEDEEPCEIDQESERENEIMAEAQDEEVSKAKIKLIVRLWRRRSRRQRELREQRQLAAKSALNFLSFGPPVRLNQAQPSKLGEFDIDHAVRERYEKHEQSWSRLNVSDVTENILRRRNPDAKCICWKIVVCSSQIDSVDSSTAHLEAGSWLMSKLMPSKKDDDLAVTSPELSIWKSWVKNKSGANSKCCLSVVKNANFGNLNENVSGASALLFVVSEVVPWHLQKVQLHNLLMSIHGGSRLPLLIISGLHNEDVSNLTSIIVNELGLNNIDTSRVSSFLVVSLVTHEQMGKANGFFSDVRLREGLKWLASESPLQPALHCIKARELVLTHLTSYLNMLDNAKVGPNHFISVFNEALEQSMKNIASASDANPSNWPCPEITFLDSSTDEQLMAKLYLPNVGWSYNAKIEPLESVLNDCKLPNFCDDISWLDMGCSTRNEIESLKLQLENGLTRYLTQTKMMGVTLASKEACVMVQRNTLLELNHSSYYIIPNWFNIFRRVFNWRLMSLSSGPLSSAYVLESHLTSSALDIDKVVLENSLHSPHISSYPSLDEMIEISCTPMDEPQINPFQPPPMDEPQIKPFQPPPVPEDSYAGNSMECESNFSQNFNLATEHNEVAYLTKTLNNSNSKSEKATMEAEELSRLLEQCNILQDNIAEKLSIYF